MLEFALWGLWRQVKGPLKSALGDKFSLVGGQLKALLSSTIDDLTTAIQESFFGTETWNLAKGEIKRKKKDDRITIEAFPLTAIAESSKIRDALVVRLKKNVRLDAMRTDAGVSDTDWNRIVESYAGDMLRSALPYAIGRMMRNEAPLYLENYVIDIAELEPIKVNGKAGHHKLVILYEKPYSDDDPNIAKAAKIWKQRTNEAYEYHLGEYDGFKAA